MYVGCTVQQDHNTTMMLSVEKGPHAIGFCCRSYAAVGVRAMPQSCRVSTSVTRVPAEEAERRDGGAIAAMLRRPIGLLPSAATRAERIPESVAHSYQCT